MIKQRDRLNRATSLNIILASLFFFVQGCSGKLVHKDLRPDTRVMVRQWTLATHGEFEAGDQGFEYSNPILFENSLIFGSQTVGLVALYPTLMQTHWVLPIKGGVVSEIAIERGHLYFGAGDGFLYSVNAENGRVDWRYDMHNIHMSKPTLDGGRLFVTTTDDVIYAFDAGTGKWLWHYRRRSSKSSSTLLASSPLADGNEIIAGLSDGFLVALNVNDGQLKWERKLNDGTKFTDVDAHPILENGIIYIPSYDGALYALKRSNGEVIWKFDAGGSRQVVLEGDRIYLPSSEGAIYALQKNNARVLWKFELDSGTPTHLVVTDRHIIFGSSYQYLYALDKKDGTGLYRYNVGYGSGFSGRLGWDQERQRVYALSGAGNLMAFSVRPPLRKVRPHGATEAYTD